ncbi:MAG: chromosome segregation protein SMC [Candidatus Omnitrophota bacterium]|jgi:chromosome segregation protein
MHFKSLELIGFKSFAEKTKLNFEPGVTAIVGPNGCGKSNIADSIRWVLGEQSAKSLRASNMQDVIFNGTDTKEAINFAEVSLTFSNEKRLLPIDYDEVTITRRVFRSSETEYLLNKTPVRLKDINELLMGTGIGTESYSIIEQGKMDLILSSRPEDRRFVFEEASGITKFKSKKKEALRKLEQTEQNILRINDIITEVKRQISSIERQARKAERYKVDFDKLRDMEIKLSSREYRSLKTEEMTMSVENNDCRAREGELDAEIKSMASRISGYRGSLDEVNQKLLDLKDRYKEMSGSLDMNTQKISINKERIEESRVLQEGLRKEIAVAAEKLKYARGLVEKLKADLASASSAKIAKAKSLEEKNLLLVSLSKDIDETENRVKTCKVEIVDHLSKETHIKNDLIKMGADIQNRRSRVRRLGIEKDTVVKELESIEGVLKQVAGEFKDIEDRVSAMRQDLESKRNANGLALSEIKSTEERMALCDNRKAVVGSKIEILGESIKRHEGFGRGVRNLLDKIDEGAHPSGGILGVLADVIKVERGYEEAVNALLGDNAQVIISEKDSDIVGMISYLKENNLGRASFVSLETVERVKRGQGAGNVRTENVTAPLKNFIRIEPKLTAIIEHFFADAYLTDSIEECIKSYDGSSAKFITKSGAILDDGKVSGGSVSATDESLLIGRRERLEDLKNELIDMEKEVAALGIIRDDKRNEASLLQAEIGSLEERLHTEDINLANVRTRKESHETGAAKLRDEFELLNSELDEANAAIADLTQKGEAFNLELNNIETQKAQAQKFIDESQNLILERRTRREKETLEIATLTAEAQSLEKEEEGISGSLKTQEGVSFDLEETIYQKESLLKESADKEKSLGEEIMSLTAQNEKIQSDLLVFNEESSAIEKSKSEIVDKLGVDEAQLKTKEAGLESLRNQARDMDVKLTELNYKKTNLKERISQTYKMDLETEHVETEENADWETVKAQVAEFKERLDKIGPVNLVAIDEHKELEERYAFLTHQLDDLVNAKDSLHKAIQKINKTTKDLFIETFQKIQVEFKNFFRLLFGGGQAELVLIDEQDVLECGIEIIVRPPGKKLQNLMLLSGGEKAMTATALLFAIFKVKPSPFCVLDEIDAPLDESNVTRFASVLKDFLKISQFIIITHNKRTIELADVMYGITMQERGVSKIVSVKFSDELKKKITVGAPTRSGLVVNENPQETAAVS